MNLIGEEATTCTLSDISNSFGRRNFNFIREKSENFFKKSDHCGICLAASCAVKTSRALARKRDNNVRQWRAMKLFIRYREELKRSVKMLWRVFEPFFGCLANSQRKGECAVKHESVLLMDVLVMVRRPSHTLWLPATPSFD